MQVDGYSLDAQRDKLRKYAAYEDMIIAGEYSDEGFSGKNIQGRQDFQRMLNDIQDGKDGVSYVLVFKLSRFGRNAADVLNSLQLMQDFGVNLICVEDGIDSSKDAGKLMISVLSAVAEIERENIRTQTMAGREQKAREGKWNGGFAPYGYKLENGDLVIAEDEAEVIRVIYSALSECEFLEDIPALAGEETFFGSLNTETGLLFNANGNAKGQDIVEHAFLNDKSFDEIMNEWNERWTAAQKKYSIEISK